MHVQINCLILFGWVPRSTHTGLYNVGIIVFASVLNVIIARFSIQSSSSWKEQQSFGAQDGSGWGWETSSEGSVQARDWAGSRNQEIREHR